jgi:predicted metal-dependent phosphoesterase TrpH
MKIDLHIHSAHSRDAKATPAEILRACKRVGLDGCAISDHNEIKGALDALELSKSEGLIVVPAVEVSAREGHVLAYGVKEMIPRGLSVEETIEKISAAGGIAVAAHPDRFPSGVGLDIARRAKFDAIEVLNGGSSAKSNRLARAIAAERRMPMTGGSDAHELEKIGRAYTVIEGVSSAADVVERISQGKTSVAGSSRSGTETVTYAVEVFFGWLLGGFKRL